MRDDTGPVKEVLTGLFGTSEDGEKVPNRIREGGKSCEEFRFSGDL